MTERKILKVPKRRLSCRIEEGRVREYADKMRRGEWKEKMHDGTPLIVMKEGELINGQHRLMAVVKYGKSLRMQVLVYERIKI